MLHKKQNADQLEDEPLVEDIVVVVAWPPAASIAAEQNVVHDLKVLKRFMLPAQPL